MLKHLLPGASNVVLGVTDRVGYKARNKEQIKEYRVEYYARNKEQVKEKQVEHYSARPVQQLKKRIRGRLRNLKMCSRTNLDLGTSSTP